MIPQFTLNVPVLGSSWAVGLAFQIHLIFVPFIMGLAIVAPVAELMGLRPGGQYWDRLSRDLVAAMIKLFSFAATWAVLALVLVYGLYPRLFGVLTGIFFWPLVVVGVLWFVMTLSVYLYGHTWERLAHRRGLHVALGATFAISTFAFISTITFLSSYQLTPADPNQLLASALNPSWPTEILHRHVGNLSYAGILLAAFAGAQILYFSREENDRAYYDWLGHLGFLLGVGLALFQPIAGWLYTSRIQAASPGAYYLMMIGDNGWMFLVQTFLFGSVLFLGNLYLASAIHRGNPGPGATAWMRNSLWAIGLLALLATIPKEWPLGAMSPWKYIGLGGLVLLSLINMGLYWRARRGFVWGSSGNGAQVAAVLLGAAIVALIVTMGIIRSSARGDYLIYDRLGPGQSQQIEQP
ncbi:MAG: cytochrome ubiquinol oxidase subunit I [Chloroflexota bacterium]